MIYVTKDVSHIGGGSTSNRGNTTIVGNTNVNIGSGIATGGPGMISTAVSPTIVVTVPKDDDIVRQSTITTTTTTQNQKFFGFPPTAYKPQPPKLD